MSRKKTPPWYGEPARKHTHERLLASTGAEPLAGAFVLRQVLACAVLQHDTERVMVDYRHAMKAPRP